jgi:sphinganine-1-phosphate aldolase
MSDALDRLRTMQADDLPVHTGRTLAYVYDSGLPEVDRVGREAVAAYAASNGLDPTAFPSMLAMENELVGLGLDLADGPEGAVGSVTSGGTESCLLAVQAARDGGRLDGTMPAHPTVVVPETVHAAFHKAAHYFGVRTRVVPVGPDFRADPVATAEAVDDDTVLVVASAPSYAQGVVDPVPALAGLAAERGVRCHVDACIGGWVLGYAARLDRPVPAWSFAVEGVTSISVDTHKYGYAPKGTSLLLHRSSPLRRSQYFAFADWPGYTMLNSTMQSTKSGGPLAGAWAVASTLGDDGYLRLTARALDATRSVLDLVAGIDGISVLVEPDTTLVALATDDRCDAFTICDEMAARGWYVQPQMSRPGQVPPTVHLSVSAATADALDDLGTALREAVAAARDRGPVRVDPDVAGFVAALDPTTLGEQDFDGLLVAAGLGAGDPSAGLVLPDRMAEVNALLDLASPALREELLVALLDRLQRPTRGAG